jgi:hypothetical protein
MSWNPALAGFAWVRLSRLRQGALPIGLGTAERLRAAQVAIDGGLTDVAGRQGFDPIPAKPAA